MDRAVEIERIERLFEQFPVVAILGARQTGKTTLTRSLVHDHFFDLENPRDEARLSQPQLALESLQGRIVIDEIQRKPDIFPLLRYLVDTHPEQRYLILGSASRELVSSSSESLAGRIGFHRLSGFSLADVGENERDRLWMRGGFPLSYLATSDSASALWRENYVATFLERDIPQLGIRIPAPALRRFWTMLSHYHGQLLNYSELASSMGISDMTVRRYMEILEGTFMIRLLQPWYANLGKRLVKSPKLYFRDSGLFHYFQTISDKKDLESHPRLGASWEGFAMDAIIRALGMDEKSFYFFRTQAGSELDLFWRRHGKNYGVEFKYADAPRTTKSIHLVVQDLDLTSLWIVYPGDQEYALSEKVTVTPLSRLTARLS